MYCAGHDYITFLKNLNKFLSCDMSEYHKTDYIDGTIGIEQFYPCGILENSVRWVFNHDSELSMPISRWNKKRHEVNFDNIAVIMIIQSDEDAYEFEKLDIKKKVGFYYKNLGLKSIVVTDDWPDSVNIRTVNGSYPLWVNQTMSNFGKTSKVDWIRFLLGEENYRRCDG